MINDQGFILRYSSVIIPKPTTTGPITGAQSIKNVQTFNVYFNMFCSKLFKRWNHNIHSASSDNKFWLQGSRCAIHLVRFSIFMFSGCLFSTLLISPFFLWAYYPSVNLQWYCFGCVESDKADKAYEIKCLESVYIGLQSLEQSLRHNVDQWSVNTLMFACFLNWTVICCDSAAITKDDRENERGNKLYRFGFSYVKIMIKLLWQKCTMKLMKLRAKYERELIYSNAPLMFMTVNRLLSNIIFLWLSQGIREWSLKETSNW